jgi:tripartite-type tricarboxylate transporter receptor subunit TctC
LTILRFYELAIISMIALAAHHASAQEYPIRAIRIVTPGVGGSADFSSRLIGQAISGPLGQQIIIDNRPTGPIPGEIVSKAAPDGYTLLLAGGSFFIGPLVQKTPYDPITDFVAISLTATQPNVLVVHPSMPVNSVKELIVLAKARPGSMNYSMAGIGSSGHLAAELFKYMAKVDVAQINYKGAGAALTDLLAGQVHMTFATAASVVPLMKSGRLKALAVTSAKPSVLFPGLPTVASSGLPGYETVSNLGLLAPARTPEAIIARLNMEVVRAMKLPDIKEKLMNAGTEAVGSTPAEFEATMKSEMSRMGKIIKSAGIGTGAI